MAEKYVVFNISMSFFLNISLNLRTTEYYFFFLMALGFKVGLQLAKQANYYLSPFYFTFFFPGRTVGFCPDQPQDHSCPE
jgi:hypothetical protein